MADVVHMRTGFFFLSLILFPFVGEVLLLPCAILIGLFALQHSGTHRVAFMFAPIVIVWLISIFVIGLYNIIYWNPKIVSALSPHYIIKYFHEGGTDGWISLGGVLLSIAGMWGLVLLFIDIVIQLKQFSHF